LKRIFRDSAHLIRPALVLLAALGIFMAVRAAVIPKGFGKYGHYRPGALETVRATPISYAGQDTCLLCHEDQGKARAAGGHGPQAKHANDPSAAKPALPDVANLCRRCHEKDSAKPEKFPQVVTAEHSGGAVCNTCHQPHNPRL
jgi:hypothetical protein